ncbi:MAG: protein kinase [Candidatus Margulisiibacteriota bacterium]
MQRFGNGKRKYADRYSLHNIIGIGAYGVVFEATDTSLSKSVVLKISCEENIWHLEREAIQLGRLSSLPHQYFVRTYSNGYGDRIGKTTTFFIAMEPIDGYPLSDEILAGDISFERTIDVALQLCQGSWEANKLGFVNRDLKPNNILVRKIDGSVTIIDPASEIYTNRYATPQWLRSQRDPHPEIYAIGAIMHEMLSGLSPFYNQSRHFYQLVHAKSTSLLPALTFVPEFLQFIVDTATMPEDGQRFKSLEDLFFTLESAQTYLAQFHNNPSALADEIKRSNSAGDTEQRMLTSGHFLRRIK